VSIHGGRASLAYRVTMFASRHFQKLDEEAAPTAGAAPAAEADAAPALPPAEDAAAEAPAPAPAAEDAADDADALAKPATEERSAGGKIVLVGDDELNVAMQRYYENHPSAYTWSTTQQLIGGIVALIAAGVLIYSEVNAMLLQRDLDALKAAELLGAPKSIELAQRELWWGNGFKAQWRVLLSGGALGMVTIAIFVAFSSECPMLDKLKEKYDLSHTHSDGNCLLLAILLSVLNAAGWCALFAGVTWMCTRPLPGIGLIVLSITADMFNTSDNLTPIVTWIVCASFAVGAYIYFTKDDETSEESDALLDKGPREFV